MKEKNGTVAWEIKREKEKNGTVAWE